MGCFYTLVACVKPINRNGLVVLHRFKKRVESVDYMTIIKIIDCVFACKNRGN